MLIVGILLASCSGTKFVSDGQYMLNKVEVKKSFSAVQKSFPFILDWIPLREPQSALERAVGVRLYLLISCGSVVGPSTISLPLSSMRMRSISTTRSSGLLFMRPW